MNDGLEPYCIIYKRLVALGVLEIKGDGHKYRFPPFMDLNVDILSREPDKIRIALAHNFIQEGDVMADPDMEIMIYPKLECAEALTYQLDSLGIYQEVYDGDNPNMKLKKELNDFLLIWLKNLSQQGFYRYDPEDDA